LPPRLLPGSFMSCRGRIIWRREVRCVWLQ
jgi:hypothetical protein